MTDLVQAERYVFLAAALYTAEHMKRIGEAPPLAELEALHNFTDWKDGEEPEAFAMLQDRDARVGIPTREALAALEKAYECATGRLYADDYYVNMRG